MTFAERLVRAAASFQAGPASVTQPDALPVYVVTVAGRELVVTPELELRWRSVWGGTDRALMDLVAGLYHESPRPVPGL